jgi:hypothetical protein
MGRERHSKRGIELAALALVPGAVMLVALALIVLDLLGRF